MVRTSGRVSIFIEILVYVCTSEIASTLHQVRLLYEWQKILTINNKVWKKMHFPINRDSS